jgi:hypothetical protein
MLRGSARDKFKLPDAQVIPWPVLSRTSQTISGSAAARVSVEFLRGGEICRDQPFVRNLSQNSDDGQLGTSELARAF